MPRADRTLLLVHSLAPPRPGGTAIVLRRLLAALDGWRLEVVTDVALRRAVRADDGRALPARYRYAFRITGRPFTPRVLFPLVGLVDVVLALVAGAWAAATRRRDPPDVVLSVVDDGFSQIAGALAARLMRRPHVVMVFDLWRENAYPRVPRLVARAIEGRLLRSAAAVVVYCETAATHYRDKHGVECDVLDIPVDVGDEPRLPADESRPSELLVAGAIYWAQEDAVRRLLRAAARIRDIEVTIVGDEDQLRARGIVANRFEPPLPQAEFRRRVAGAGILFIGLSFDTPYPDVIRTATPARLAEYMAAGRPLLVHAPAGSHSAEYARGEDFAEVVDEADDGALERGLRAIVDDGEHARVRAATARRLALERHDTARVADRLGELLEDVAAGRGDRLQVAS